MDRESFYKPSSSWNFSSGFGSGCNISNISNPSFLCSDPRAYRDPSSQARNQRRSKAFIDLVDINKNKYLPDATPKTLALSLDKDRDHPHVPRPHRESNPGRGAARAPQTQLKLTSLFSREDKQPQPGINRASVNHHSATSLEELSGCDTPTDYPIVGPNPPDTRTVTHHYFWPSSRPGHGHQY